MELVSKGDMKKEIYVHLGSRFLRRVFDQSYFDSLVANAYAAFELVIGYRVYKKSVHRAVRNLIIDYRIPVYT